MRGKIIVIDFLPQELVMDNCNWFDTHDLVLFSKLKNLKKLSLRGCESLKECVPYGSISTRFGFKKLEVIIFPLINIWV